MELNLNRGFKTLIDESDYKLVSQYHWTACWTGSGWYVMTKIERRVVYLHRLILSAQPHQIVDHLNHDGLDNRRTNIRLATYRQNNCNRRPRPGQYKGITRVGERWKAQIFIEGRKVYLGLFDTDKEAAEAYDAAARAHFGEFAWLNFPTGVESELSVVDI